MSSGFVHAKASLILAAGFSVGALLSRNPEIMRCTLGALTGILLSPDLDVDGGNISGKIIKEKVGWFGERVWRWFWRDYSKSFKHGQFGSHFPGFSTFIRLIYIYSRTVLPFYATSLFFLGAPYIIWAQYEMNWWLKIFFNPLFFYGLFSSDTIHFFLDILTTEHKQSN